MTPSTTLLTALGIDQLELNERVEMLNDLRELIFEGTLVRLLETMGAAEKDALDELLAADADEDTVLAFLKERVPQADDAVADTIAELESDILAVTGK